MPELPEVESTVQFLRERVLGARIATCVVAWKRTVAIPSAELFSRSLKGAVITDVGRRGKFIAMSVTLTDGDKRCLFVHLRMSGSIDVLSGEFPREKHDRVVFVLDDGREIRFNDPRKFGRCYLARDAGYFEERLGIEPLSEHFTPSHLAALLRGRRGALKPLLLNQRVIAGLGNIYVDESLWESKLHPLRSADSLRAVEVERLHQAIQRILRSAIASAGTDFGDGVVHNGGYTPLVYGREGEPCHYCKNEVQRIVVGQRGTHYCPHCQRAPRRTVARMSEIARRGNE